MLDLSSVCLCLLVRPICSYRLNHGLNISTFLEGFFNTVYPYLSINNICLIIIRLLICIHFLLLMIYTTLWHCMTILILNSSLVWIIIIWQLFLLVLMASSLRLIVHYVILYLLLLLIDFGLGLFFGIWRLLLYSSSICWHHSFLGMIVNLLCLL